MSNVGDTQRFELYGSHRDGLRYVWQWWDRSVTVVGTNVVDHVLNQGGDPNDGLVVRFTATVVDEIGQNATYGSSLAVNNPPGVVPAPSISRNDEVFPFDTNIAVTAYDFESDAITASLYDNGTFVAGPTSETGVGLVNGTYNGTYAGMYSGTLFEFVYTVEEDKNLEVVLVDSAEGTTVLPFVLRGRAPTDPYVAAGAVNPGVSGDASGVASQRIGTAEHVEFSVITMTDSAPTVVWSYAGTDGWTTSPAVSSGTLSQLPSGSWKNRDVRSIASETAGVKKAVAVVTDNDQNVQVVVEVPVTLVSNTAPTTPTVATSADGTFQVNSSDSIRYVATASDPEGDILVYRWDFTNPVLPSIYGRTAYVDTDDLSPTPFVVQGNLVVTDRFGASRTVALPDITVI